MSITGTQIVDLDREELVEFANVLDSAGYWIGATEAILFFEKPWKWEKEYALWVSLGKPTEAGAAWDEFEAGL